MRVCVRARACVCVCIDGDGDVHGDGGGNGEVVAVVEYAGREISAYLCRLLRLLAAEEHDARA